MNIDSPSQAQLDSLLKHYQTGDYGEAEKIAIFLTKQFPKHQFSWKVLGALLKQTGRISEAFPPMKKASQLMPQDAEAHSNLGVTFKE